MLRKPGFTASPAAKTCLAAGSALPLSMSAP
jgi:hypothetical protein